MKKLIYIAAILGAMASAQAQPMMLFDRDSLASITSPLDVDSLFYWFAADVAVLDSAGGTISGGEGVGTWTDLSGNGYNVVQADTTKDPRWCTSCGPASYPAIVFNGADEFLASSSHWWGSDDLTVFVVMKFGNATRDASEIVVAKWEASGSWFFQGGPTSIDYAIDFRWREATNTSTYFFRSTSAKSTAYKLISSVYNGLGAYSLYFDSSLDVTTTNAGTYTIRDLSSNFSIGAVNTGSTPVSFIQASISEIIVFSRALSATERTAIENYLNVKYDLY